MLLCIFLRIVPFLIICLQFGVDAKFSCEGRASGYYADVDAGCQVYHMCDGLGRQFSYSCPNTTLFQQRMLVCDHWYMVNCSKSELDYSANLLIGQKDKPFVEDSLEHPYHRTPRPDLLQKPYAPRFQDEAYRQGRAHALIPPSRNLVGVATKEENEESSTDEPQYLLPSHWSTEYGKLVVVTTPLPVKATKKPPFVKNPSNTQFTPKHYKVITKIPESILPPLLPALRKSDFDFDHDHDSGSGSDSENQEAITPSTRILPPLIPISPPAPSVHFEPPKLTITNVEPSTTMDPETFYKLVPSKDLEPPRGPSNPDLKITTTTVRTLIKKATDASTHVVSADERWKELRQMFFIPEYDFPLEVASRPSYDGGLSSFQVNHAPPLPEARAKESIVNSECPKCDPAFLVPGTCKPCVMIRR